jgi:hypothetical protein
MHHKRAARKSDMDYLKRMPQDAKQVQKDASEPETTVLFLLDACKPPNVRAEASCRSDRCLKRFDVKGHRPPVVD